MKIKPLFRHKKNVIKILETNFKLCFQVDLNHSKYFSKISIPFLNSLDDSSFTISTFTYNIAINFNLDALTHHCPKYSTKPILFPFA